MYIIQPLRRRFQIKNIFMSLPKFDTASVIRSQSHISIEPLYEGLFEVEADLPVSFLENIVDYDLDVDNKKVTFSVQLNEEYLSEMQLFSAERIKIVHHDRTGSKILISTELETITNPSFISIKASYATGGLLVGRFTFRFGTIYQQLLGNPK